MATADEKKGASNFKFPTCKEVQDMVKKNDVRYEKGLRCMDEFKGILSVLGTSDVNENVWKRMQICLTKAMKLQLQNQIFKYEPMKHRFPDIYPYDYNAMEGFIGSWMGDCFGLMQWPMPDEESLKLVEKVVEENNVELIVIIGVPEPDQRVEMSFYWFEMGEDCSDDYDKNHCTIRDVYKINGTKKDIKIMQFAAWPDMGAPKKMENFEYLFKEMEKVEKRKKNIIIHCRAGVGRSGTLRLMYRVWQGKITQKNMTEEVIKSRALRMWTVQTLLQWNFLKKYVEKFQKIKLIQELTFKEKAQQYIDKDKDYKRAAFWFFKYMVHATARPLEDYNLTLKRMTNEKDREQFDKCLRFNFSEKRIVVGLTYEAFEKMLNDYSGEVAEIEEKGEPLTNKGAKAFWDTHFDGKDRVKNNVYKAELVKHLKEKGLVPDNTDEFAEQMVTQVFYSFKDNNFVDHASIQNAINVFGPWSKIFKSVEENLNEKDKDATPKDYFHGRLKKEELDPKLKKVGDYALRYYTETDREGRIQEGIMLAWADKGDSKPIIKEERIRRRKLKHGSGKRVVWTWEENLHHDKIKLHDFESFPLAIAHLKELHPDPSMNTGSLKLHNIVAWKK